MRVQVLFFLLCGVLFVRSTPFHHDASIDLLKSNEVHQPLESDSNNKTLTAISSNETLEVAQQQENINSVVEGVFESTIIFEFEHGNGHGHHGHEHEHNHGHDHHASKKIGPVELGLRNLVAASSIASEELYLEMAALSSDTSEMVFDKSELLTAHAMNEIFKPLSLTESEIRKNQDCGRQFVDSLNAILKQVDSNLKTCTYNLTKLGNSYKNESATILSSISMAADNMNNLADSCEITDNFAAGTFCIVNNLAETNTQVVLEVKNMRQTTKIAREEFSKAASSTMTCNKQVVETVTGKLNNLLKQVSDKCVQTKPQNLEI